MICCQSDDHDSILVSSVIFQDLSSFPLSRTPRADSKAIDNSTTDVLLEFRQFYTKIAESKDFLPAPVR